MTINISSLANPSSSYLAKRYRCLVLDPPWRHHQQGKLGASQHYPLMSTQQIASLPIPDLLKEDAHVWVWCTVASRFDAQRIATQEWNLTFRSELVWDKRKTGLGNYLRGSHESLLLFTKGKAPIQFKAQRDVVDWPVQDHSHKPEEALVMVQRCSPGPYLELFARARFPGFDHWGNEVPGGADIFLPGFPVPAYSSQALAPQAGSRDQWHDGVIRKVA